MREQRLSGFCHCRTFPLAIHTAQCASVQYRIAQFQYGCYTTAFFCEMPFLRICCLACVPASERKIAVAKDGFFFQSTVFGRYQVKIIAMVLPCPNSEAPKEVKRCVYYILICGFLEQLPKDHCCFFVQFFIH